MKHEKASDTLKHQPRGLQYLTHAHSHITHGQLFRKKDRIETLITHVTKINTITTEENTVNSENKPLRVYKPLR